jgi:hypothetical protein
MEDFKLITEALNAASTRGVFTIEESALIYRSLTSVKQKLECERCDDTQTNKEGPKSDFEKPVPPAPVKKQSKSKATK